MTNDYFTDEQVEDIKKLLNLRGDVERAIALNNNAADFLMKKFKDESKRLGLADEESYQVNLRVTVLARSPAQAIENAKNLVDGDQIDLAEIAFKLC